MCEWVKQFWMMVIEFWDVTTCSLGEKLPVFQKNLLPTSSGFWAGRSSFLQKVGVYLPDSMESHPRSQSSTVTAATTSNTMTLHDFPNGKVSKHSVKCILASVYYCILFLGNTKIQYAVLNSMYIQLHVLSLQHYLNSWDILPYLEVHW